MAKKEFATSVTGVNLNAQPKETPVETSVPVSSTIKQVRFNMV